MSLVFEPPGDGGALRQGELLEDVWVLRPLHAASELRAGEAVEVEALRISRLFVLHADCDLHQDFNTRRSPLTERETEETRQSSLIPQILACAAFDDTAIRSRLPVGSEFWRRVRNNQEERYHCLPSAPIAPAQIDLVPQLVIDFRRTFAIFTMELYAAIQSGAVKRKCIVPPVHVHDLMHRFFGYLSRVGLPD